MYHIYDLTIRLNIIIEQIRNSLSIKHESKNIIQQINMLIYGKVKTIDVIY